MGAKFNRGGGLISWVPVRTVCEIQEKSMIWRVHTNPDQNADQTVDPSFVLANAPAFLPSTTSMAVRRHGLGALFIFYFSVCTLFTQKNQQKRTLEVWR